MIATAPLTTNESWQEMGRGDLIAFIAGAAYSSESELAAHFNTLDALDTSVRQTPDA